MAELTKGVTKSKSLKKSGDSAIQRKNDEKATHGANDASMLVGEDGTTIIHNEVVAKFAGMTVQEVTGKNVRERIESMTGLECVEVNIEMLDLHFQDELQVDENALRQHRVQWYPAMRKPRRGPLPLRGEP